MQKSKYMKRIFLYLVTPLLLFPIRALSQEPSHSVFHSNRGGERQWLTLQDNHRALYRIITNEAFRLLDERAKNVTSIQSGENWKAHQQKVREVLCNSLAKFEKTPLNARVTGVLTRETFTVEKVLFESHPGFYVTAGLFLPKERQHPAPTVIYACGHTDLGFRSETYQHVILNLVDKGFIVFAFDPIGQGERMQYPGGDDGKSKIGGPTREHSYAGVQTLLTGTSLTDYFIWDGIRVLDYLETRREVDMKRIGITGRSGGGTQTAQIAACDDRIYAAAPECYITSFKRLLQSIGPQDAEQNPYNAIVKGFDHADYLHIHAPKPALIITTTHDFFSIQGARETFSEVQRSYAALGKPENIEMTEDLGRHESTQKNRETLYAFFQKHLNLKGDPSDTETSPFTLKELWVTPTGQVVTSHQSKTVFNLNKEYFPGKSFHPGRLKEQVTATAGIRFDRNLTAAVYTGKFFSEGIEVQKYFLENSTDDFALPVYLIKPVDKDPEKLIVWFHPEGKGKVPDEPHLQELLDDGYAIISADLPGMGELLDKEFTGDGVSQRIPLSYTFGANLAGKSIAGIQAEAIDLLMQFIGSDARFTGKKAEAFVQGNSASAFLLYAVMKNPFHNITFHEFPGSAMDLIREEYYDPAVASTIAPGSLLHFDLPDLTGYLKNSGAEVIIQ
jgi:cephalosporin-C deacetylase-like acetyl esterase